MEAAWVKRKLEAVRVGWKERFDVEPTIAEAAMALAVATHETLAGDSWPGENNWGALQRPDGGMSPEDKQKLEAHGLWPAEDPRTKEGAARLEQARRLVTRPGGGLHVDSGPTKGWYYQFFYAFPTEADGASFFLKTLFDFAGVRAVIGTGDAGAVAEAMYRSHYFEGFHDPRPREGEHPAAAGFPMKGELTTGQRANVNDYAGALRALYAEFTTKEAYVPAVPDLSFRKLVPGESKEDRLCRIAYYIASLGDKESRALLEPGAQTAQWTCMVFARACVWHACCLPEDGIDKLVIINGHTFGRYGDDEDRTILGSLMLLSGKFVDARPPHGTDLALARGAIAWQSAPAGGNDHVVLVRAWRDRKDGAVDVDTSEGGQTPVNARNFARTWRKRADGRWDNAGASGSPAPGSSIIQGIAYCEWPILTAPAEDPHPSGTLGPEAPTRPDSPAAMPEADPFPDPVSRETGPDESKIVVTKKGPTALQFALVAIFGVGAAIVGWLARHC